MLGGVMAGATRPDLALHVSAIQAEDDRTRDDLTARASRSPSPRGPRGGHQVAGQGGPPSRGGSRRHGGPPPLVRRVLGCVLRRRPASAQPGSTRAMNALAMSSAVPFLPAAVGPTRALDRLRYLMSACL